RVALEPLLTGQSGDVQLAQLTRVLERKACALADLGQTQEAADLLRHCVDDSRACLRASADDRTARGALSEALWDLSRLHGACGQAPEATRLVEQIHDLWKDRDPAELADLAASLAARANVIGYGETKISEDGERVRRFDREEAAATLRRALTQGYKDL